MLTVGAEFTVLLPLVPRAVNCTVEHCRGRAGKRPKVRDCRALPTTEVLM